MADQELGLRLKTDSDVPAAMGKAQSAVVSFDKQVQDVQKKFSTAFKDIFLGFTAPMVIIQSAIQMISSAIEKAKQDAKDGLDLISKGETAFASSEEARLAQFIKVKQATEEEQRKVQAGRVEMTEKFFTDTEKGRKIMQKMEEDAAAGSSGEYVVPSPGQLAMQKYYQDMALKEFLNSEQGKKFQYIFNDKNNANFKGPEGFSNVVGVGSNPVMEAMAEQLEIQKQQLAALQEIAAKDKNSQTDFTKDTK